MQWSLSPWGPRSLLWLPSLLLHVTFILLSLGPSCFLLFAFIAHVTLLLRLVLADTLTGSLHLRRCVVLLSFAVWMILLVHGRFIVATHKFCFGNYCKKRPKCVAKKQATACNKKPCYWRPLPTISFLTNPPTVDEVQGLPQLPAVKVA